MGKLVDLKVLLFIPECKTTRWKTSQDDWNVFYSKQRHGKNVSDFSTSWIGHANLH